MKKGICLGSLPRQLSLRDKLALAKDSGFDGIECNTCETESEAEQLRSLANELGLEIHSVMDSLHWKCPLSSPDDEVREKGIAHIEQSVKTAQIVGADTVLVVPGVVNEQTPYELAWERSLDALKRLAPVAAEAQVYLCLENVWNKFLLSPREMVEFIDSVGSPWVQAYFDCGNIMAYGYPQHWIRSLGSRLKKVHVKGFHVAHHRFVYLFEGDVPWPQVMRALGEVGYDGYLTAEMPPYPCCPGVAVADIARHLDQLIGML